VSGKVSKWEDQSGNGYDATQTVAGSCPALVTGDADFNGNASLLLDGVNDHLRCDAIVSFINGTDLPYTVFTVHKKDATGGQFMFDMGTSGSDGNAQWCVGIRHFGRDIYIQDKRANGGVEPEVNFEVGHSPTTPEVVAWLCDGKNGETIANGVSVGSGSVDVNKVDCVYATLGGFPDYINPTLGTLNGPLKGKLVEVAVFNRLLTQSEINTMQTYFNQKFNLY
jgi:hypothetical protein